MNKISIVSGYQNTKMNEEDIALTPYLFGVLVKGNVIKVYGIGICWLHHSIYIGLGFNIPNKLKGF